MYPGIADRMQKEITPGSPHHEDQDHRSSREEILCLDRRLHPGLPLHLPADVDLQAGVRRVRPLHRPPQVLLNGQTIKHEVSSVSHHGSLSKQLFILIFYSFYKLTLERAGVPLTMLSTCTMI